MTYLNALWNFWKPRLKHLYRKSLSSPDNVFYLKKELVQMTFYVIWVLLSKVQLQRQALKK